MYTFLRQLIKPVATCLGLAFMVFVSCKKEINTLQNESLEISVVTEATNKRMDSTLTSFVDSGNIAGIWALIFENGNEGYFNTFGNADKESQKPLERNTIIKIYSMINPITGTALLTLYKEEKFDLDDLISKYAPERPQGEVYTEVDCNGKITTKPVDRPVTIRDAVYGLTRRIMPTKNQNS